MIVAVDVDGPIADLHTAWINRYNKDYKDGLVERDITTWDIHKYVKPECGHKIYDYLRMPDIYDDVKVSFGAKEGVEFLKQHGCRVVYLTAAPTGFSDAKQHWLVREGFLDKSKYTHEDLVVAKDKSLIRAQVLIDDGPHNIETFPGMCIVYDAPYNKDIKKPRYYRMAAWPELPVLWEKIYG